MGFLPPATSPTPALQYLHAVQRLLAALAEAEQASLRQAADACAASIGAGRAVLLFGAGHSALPCQEAFPRIGSIVGFVQLTEPALGFNGHVTGKGGQRQMSFLEQTSGFAEVILSNYTLTPEDTLIVFSHSGINALPVELCALANAQGLTTIGVSSLAHSNAHHPKNPLGKRLCEVAQIVIDNHTPEGDALIDLAPQVRAGGGSTVAHLAIMNTLVVETIARLQAQGKFFHLYPNHNVSTNVEAMLDREEALFDAHKKLLAKL